MILLGSMNSSWIGLADTITGRMLVRSLLSAATLSGIQRDAKPKRLLPHGAFGPTQHTPYRSRGRFLGHGS
jgi:hypothetical protein